MRIAAQRAVPGRRRFLSVINHIVSWPAKGQAFNCTSVRIRMLGKQVGGGRLGKAKELLALNVHQRD